MSKHELIDAYISRRINRRAFIRGLTALGVSAGVAASYAVALQPVSAGDCDPDDLYCEPEPDCDLYDPNCEPDPDPDPDPDPEPNDNKKKRKKRRKKKRKGKKH